MDKEKKQTIPQFDNEFDLLLQNSKLNAENSSSIDDFISAPITKNVGKFEQSDDSTLGEFIAKPYSEEDRIGIMATMHPELLRSFNDSNTKSNNGYKPRTFITVLKVVLPLLLCLAVAAFFYFKINNLGNECDKEYSALSLKIQELEDGSFSYLQEINSDVVGLVGFDNISYPVVKPQGNDENYYKKHLFSGKRNPYGTLYTNSNLLKDGFSDITTIYGKGTDSRMLGLIKDFQKNTDENTFIDFDTPADNGTWVLFSAFSFKEQEPFLIDKLSFLNEQLQNEYIDNFYTHSAIEFDVDTTAGDKILVLSAVDDNTTHIAAFRLLREDETKEDITVRLKESVSANTNKPNKDKNNSSKKAETTSKDKDTSSKTSSITTSSKIENTTSITASSTTSSTTTSQQSSKPQNSEKRYEQTGLTDNMDKTVKVDMAPVVTMYNVVGMTKQAAISLLEDTLGFPVKVVEQDSTESRGTVIAQSVADGAKISTDNVVTITVSVGISGGKTIMPDLIGSAEATAEILLDKHGLILGKVTEETSALEKGTILSQSVTPETEVSTNTKIDLIVSDGKGELKIVDMPNLIGKTKSEASTAIKSVGLKVGKITTVTSSKPAGTVVKQEVPKNKSVAQNEAVGFSISNGSKVNNLTVKNLSSWSVTINGKTYAPGDYIKGDYMDIIPYIVEAEMGGGFGMEALKAQAVAAYCWLINAGSTKGSAPAVPLKNPTQNAIDAAAAVNGQEVKYGSETAQTYYYAISAGSTANCKDVWYADIPYLRAVNSSVDKDYDGFETKVTYSANELQSRVLSTYGIDLSGISKTKWFDIKYDENKAYVRSATIGGTKQVTGSSFRDELLDYELRSTAFKIKYNKSDDTFTFTVRGFGHGVGMSQVGANYYAQKGWTYKEILAHYYKGTTIE